MSDERRIDALRFAKARECVTGAIPISSLARLADLVADTSGQIGYSVSGDLDDRDRPMLVVSVRGTLVLNCQRCLEPCPYRLETNTRLLLAGSEEELPDTADEGDEADWISAHEPFDVFDLVEQEIVLAVPLSPRHDVASCGAGARRAGSVVEPQTPAFAALQQLRSSE